MIKQTNLILGIILIVTLTLRLFRIDYPKTFVFDEVYYIFTAQQYLKGNAEAWEWWSKAPEGKAYGWVNPPLPQEIMAASMQLFQTQESWASRLPGVLLGTLSVYLVFLLGKLLFKNDQIGLLSALIFSLDGLNFVQSRIAMLDIYLVNFSLFSLVFFLKKKFLLSAIFLGLAVASKWTGLYLLPLLTILLIKDGLWRKTVIYLVAIPIVYLLTYTPFFLTGHTANQFMGLLKQEWWYHANLKAAHDYSSPWWSWPLNLYPVWYHVEYQGEKIANIFASGNPMVFWGGVVAIIFTVGEFFKKKSSYLLIILLGYFVFLLPWAFSPRILFLYYYAPSVPFLSLALGYQLNKLITHKKYQTLGMGILVVIILSFFLIYPLLTGIPLPKDLIMLFFKTNLTKNPF